MNVLIPKLQEVNRCLNDLISCTGMVSVPYLLTLVFVTTFDNFSLIAHFYINSNIVYLSFNCDFYLIGVGDSNLS